MNRHPFEPTGDSGTHRPGVPFELPERPAWVRTVSGWVDRFLGLDPGLTRLRIALQAVVTIGLAMAAEGLFVRLTHALQAAVSPGAPTAQAARVAGLNHGVLVVAIVFGVMIGFVSGFAGSMFTAVRAQLATLVLLPVSMIASLVLGIVLGPYRVPALAGLVGVLAAGTYFRRFGPRGFLSGQVAFMGYFLGYFLFLHAGVVLPDVGWMSAEIVVAVLVAILAQLSLFRHSRRTAVRRMLRSYTARARDVARRSLELFDQSGEPARARLARRLRHRVARLNEAALMIDARLADLAADSPGWSPAPLRRSVFDLELALTNLAHFTERLSELPPPAAARELVRRALAAFAEQDLASAERAGSDLLACLRAWPGPGDAAAGLPAGNADDTKVTGPRLPGRATLFVLYRFAMSVTSLAAAGRAWEREALPTGTAGGGTRPDSPAAAAAARDDAGFEPPVKLSGGWLPGSALVSKAASVRAEAGHGFWGRARLSIYSRLAIQMGVAASAAIALGDLLSGYRFYWAAIAAFVTFIGTNNTGEQVRKGTNRVTGTAVGVLVGGIVAHLAGNHAAVVITVVLASLFFGLYLLRISYVFLVIGITVAISELYVQFDEFSNALLLMRLEETAIGAAVTVLTVLFVLPLRPGRVARVAARDYIQAVADLTEQAVNRLIGPSGDPGPPRAAARQLDAAYQALLASMAPLRVPFADAGSNPREQFLHDATAVRHYARNLLIDTARGPRPGPRQRARLQAASAQLTVSLAQLAASEQRHDPPRRYTRSAALSDNAEDPAGTAELTTPGQLALRDLRLIDGAMAALADAMRGQPRRQAHSHITHRGRRPPGPHGRAHHGPGVRGGPISRFLDKSPRRRAHAWHGTDHRRQASGMGVARTVAYEGDPALVSRLAEALQSEGVQVDYTPPEEQRELLTDDLNQVALTIVSTGPPWAIDTASKKFLERTPRERARARVEGEDAGSAESVDRSGAPG